ncbi:MAG: glutamyl-tRNA reductase [Anaerolineae bacterium]|jgi:glutamyl-tRNA reductase
MHIVVVGLNHKVAPVEVRERLTFTRDSLRDALLRFGSRDGGCPCGPEGVILSTCNRLEIYTMASCLAEGQQAVCHFLEDFHGQSEDHFRSYLYAYTDEEAIAHLFSVAAGLDSMVLGEPQILGQVTEAMEVALAQGAAGKVLATLFRHAIEVGKRARTETAISQGTTSVSQVAVQLAEKIFGDLSSCRVLLIGAGEMAELAAQSLVKSGAESLSILNRTQKRAEQLAEQFGARPVDWEHLEEALWWADIIISSTAAPHPIIRPESLRRSRPQRRTHPLFLIDIGVPRNVDPGVGRVGDVYLYDIDDLEAVVEASLAERRQEVPKVETLISRAQCEFTSWLRSLDVVPTIVELRKQAHRMRQAELKRALQRLEGLSDHDCEVIETMTNRIVNKLLHHPTVRLKERANGSDGYRYAEVVRDLFGVGGQEGGA